MGQPAERTHAAAQQVLARASRDGERVVASARIALGVATVIAWPLWNADRLRAGVVADWVVIAMSLGSLCFSVAVLRWLRGERPERMTTALMTTSILVDAVLIVGGLATFVLNPPPDYHGIAREPGISLAFFGVVAGGIRLRKKGAVFAALVFGVGILALLVGDAAENPGVPVGAPNILTVWGVWLTAAVFSWRVATRTERHVLEGADNAADEIDKLYRGQKERVKERSRELSLLLSSVAHKRDIDGSLKPGVVLDERYEIVKKLGSGGMGSVYAGIDRATGDRVAIKVIQASSTDQLDALKRFLREAHLAADVSHPAVVHMMKLGLGDDGQFFQVQELIDGITLEEHIQHAAPLDAGAVARIAAVLCDALAAAHARTVIHRDVKPGNIMLTKATPGLKLVDFGIAKVHDTTEGAQQLGDATETGRVVGTPAYMAPEQMRGDTLTAGTDVYAAGVVFVRCLTKKLPRAGGLDALTALAERDPRVAPVVGLVQRCLADAAGARPLAASLADEFARAADALGAPSLAVVAAAAVDAAPKIAPPVDVARPGTFTRELAGLAEAQVPGALLARPRVGDYELAASLGDGPRGEVWRAVDVRTQRTVVVRVLPRDAPRGQRDAFLAAARAATALWHPCVCGVFEAGERDDATYLVVEHVPGETLRSCLDRGAIDRDRARFIAREITRGLEYVHKSGMVHGALRAENVMLDGGTVKILDLGVAAGTTDATADADADDVHALLTLLRALGLNDASTPAVLSLSDLSRAI